MKKILTLALSLLFITPLLAANTIEKPLDLIIVQGTDYVEALPDTAYFNINVTIEKDNPETAAMVGEKVRLNLKEVVALNGITKEDILQDAARISEHWDYKEKKKIHTFNYSLNFKLKQFAAITSLRKQLINEKTFAPVKEAWYNNKGLRVNQSISYEIADNRNSLETKAIEKAYKNALDKVKAIAKISNLKYEIHEISANQYQQAASRQKSYALANYESKGAGSSPLATSGDTLPTLERINASVTVKAKIIKK